MSANGPRRIGSYRPGQPREAPPQPARPQGVPGQPLDPGAPLPVALAAVSVAGQCRERSPADLALFGPGADRLVDRFADPALGQGLLARALTDGAAEAEANLLTPGGPALFRVSLWRQRGGERIRVMAAFAQSGALQPAPPPPAPLPEPPVALAQLAQDLRGPLAAVMGFAQDIRAEAGEARVPGLAADILAAAWRLLRLSDDLGRLAEGAGLAPGLGEVDLAGLTRRVLRFAAVLAPNVEVDLAALPPRGTGPRVLACERTLWSALELLAQTLLAAPGPGRLTVTLDPADPGRPLTLTLTRAEPDGTEPLSVATQTRIAELATANGAALEIAVTADETAAHLRFPAARCLDPA